MFKARAVPASLIFFLLATGAAAQALDPALTRLRDDVSAVLGQGPDQRLLLIEEDHGVTNTRTLGLGEEYAAGWRLEALAQTQATLRRGDQVQTVTLDGRRMAAAAPAPDNIVRISGVLSTSNAVEGSRTPQQTLASIGAAVARGDLRELARLGGSAADAARAIQATSDDPNRAPLPDSAQFVNVGGRVALAGPSASGGLVVFTNDAMAGFASPDDLPRLSQALDVPEPPAPPQVIGGGGELRLTLPRNGAN